MRQDGENIYSKFEAQFQQFTINIERLIERIGVPNKLSGIYTDAIKECDAVGYTLKASAYHHEGIAVRFTLKELEFYNSVYEQENISMKGCGIKRMLEGGNVILESISKLVSGTKLGIMLDIIQEIIKLTTGLYYKEDK